MTTYFGFAIADSMFPAACTVTRAPLTIDEVRAQIADCVPCLNPSHAATIEAAKLRFNLDVTIPSSAPKVALDAGDAIIVMGVRGLPRLDATRHEYTEAEISSATFDFAQWRVRTDLELSYNHM